MAVQTANPAYPNVPVFPGVPPVLRAPGATDNGTTRLTGDKSLAESANARWGIFTTGGLLVLNADNVANFEYGGERRASDFPLEGGQFESYNKVAVPFDVRITLSKGGTLADRQAFLDTADGILDDLKLYNIVTPERVYKNVNCNGLRMSRTAVNGATMLTAEFMFVEIRQSATATVSNSRAPSGADAVSAGSPQTQPPPASTAGTVIQ